MVASHLADENLGEHDSLNQNNIDDLEGSDKDEGPEDDDVLNQ